MAGSAASRSSGASLRMVAERDDRVFGEHHAKTGRTRQVDDGDGRRWPIGCERLPPLRGLVERVGRTSTTARR